MQGREHAEVDSGWRMGEALVLTFGVGRLVHAGFSVRVFEQAGARTGSEPTLRLTDSRLWLVPAQS